MISTLIAWSATHRALVLVSVAALMAVAISLLGRAKLDALPDLSDTQVIVWSRWDRSPDQVEDQLTHPLVTGLLGAPRVRAIRGYSDFGYSFVYVVFEDGTDPSWARSRVQEQLGRLASGLPEGASVQLGPNATGVGWVFQYALVDDGHSVGPDGLRSLQDWTLRYALQSVPGVAEVATVGGATREWQIAADPTRLQALGVSISELAGALRAGHGEGGGRLLDWSGAEAMIRVRGYARTQADWEEVVIRAGPGGVPIRVRDVARVQQGPGLRRGVADLDGLGDAVGGIIVMSQGENALAVIDRVRQRLDSLSKTLPPGVRIVTTYDRSELIRRAMHTLRDDLLLEVLIVSLVIALFLWHTPSAVVPILTIPISVLLSFIPLVLMGVSVNLMSLAGIAISVGVLVDGAIVEVENAYHRIHHWLEGGRQGDFHEVRLRALSEVGPSVFFSLLVIAVAFLPIFALEEQEGRLFRPLALSKTLVMATAAVLAVTLDPALRMLFARIDPFSFRPRWVARLASSALVGTYHSEDRHPISRVLARCYEPVCRGVIRWPRVTIALAVALVVASIPAARKLGNEFMPPLHEGTLLYMPSTMPGITADEAQRLLTAQDAAIARIPEVERVFGKAGRAETATDPAPLSMIETTIVLRPEDQWRHRPRWYTGRVPEFLIPPLRAIWPDRIGWDQLVEELDAALQTPGLRNAWTMPIKARTDMLATGIRTPVGIKVHGDDLAQIETVSLALERALEGLPGTRSVFAERIGAGWFFDIVPDRAALARHGLSIATLQETVDLAMGGSTVATVIEGRARIPVTLRYARDRRSVPADIERIVVRAPSGAEVPLGELASLSVVTGPSMVRDEDGFLTAYVYADLLDSDVGSWVRQAQAAVAEKVVVPPGVHLRWSGQWEAMERVKERLTLIVPLALGGIFILLSLNTGSGWKAALVLLAVPFSAVGAILLLSVLDYHLSIAVWVGIIALLGLDAETGVFMILFLDLSVAEARAAGRLGTGDEVEEALVHGAVRRLRPKLMTVCAAMIGLMPLMVSQATGSDLMKRIAAPMVGGLGTSFLLELLVYPAVYSLWLGRGTRRTVPSP